MVGAAAVRSLPQSQFLDPGRIKNGEGRWRGNYGHGCPAGSLSLSDPVGGRSRTGRKRLSLNVSTVDQMSRLPVPNPSTSIVYLTTFD